MQGKVDPDEFYVHKPTFRQGHRAVLRRSLGQKQLTMTLVAGHTRSTTHDEPTLLEKQERFCLVDGEVLTLAEYARDIEERNYPYSRSSHQTGSGSSCVIPTESG